MSTILNYFNKPILKISLAFGLATGLAAFLFFLGLYAIGAMPLGSKKSLDFGIFVIFMASACWYYRRKIGQGYMHLWEGLTICYVVNTVGAFVTGWLIYLFVAYVDPELFTRYLADMQQLLLDTRAELVKNIGEAEFQNLLNNVKETRPGELIADELSKKTIMAVLPILIISLIFRRQKPAELTSKQ